jgi:phosphoribosylformylglycinamidine synthase subunit PurQ / glutaminase
MKWGVIEFPGSNCDHDAVHTLKNVLKQDVEVIWHKDTDLKGCEAILIPGGFSYGDYLRSGAIAHVSPVMKKVIEFANQGGLVMGICNGFQILTESKLLPGALLRNANLKFICDSVGIQVENNQNAFTRKYALKEKINLPIAHMDGNYFIGPEGLKKLQDNNQIVLRYTDNPNGSVDNIAGICNEKGNVLGLMPHPERVSEKLLGSDAGRRFFESVLSV